MTFYVYYDLRQNDSPVKRLCSIVRLSVITSPLHKRSDINPFFDYDKQALAILSARIWITESFRVIYGGFSNGGFSCGGFQMGIYSIAARSSIAGLNISVSCVPVSCIVAVTTFMIVAFMVVAFMVADICECLAG